MEGSPTMAMVNGGAMLACTDREEAEWSSGMRNGRRASTSAMPRWGFSGDTIK
jgi:hypothetical protein